MFRWIEFKIIIVQLRVVLFQWNFLQTFKAILDFGADLSTFLMFDQTIFITSRIKSINARPCKQQVESSVEYTAFRIAEKPYTMCPSEWNFLECDNISKHWKSWHNTVLWEDDKSSSRYSVIPFWMMKLKIGWMQ